METGLFDVPFSRIEEVPENVTPWVSTHSTEDFPDEKLIKIDGTNKYSKVNKRKRYSQKLAKQLQSVGVDVDIDTGIEQKPPPSEGCSDFEESLKDHSPPNSTKDSRPKKLFANLADETLLALEGSSTGGMETSEDELAGWDPMKDSYEQKCFNSYGPQNFDDNFLEKHKPIRTADGKRHISPAKQGAEEMRLYIQNIPYSLSEDGIRNMFSSVGKCRDIKKCKMREGENTTFGFVTYSTVREAEMAIRKFDGFPFGNDIKLRVRLARAKAPASSEDLKWGAPNKTETGESDAYEDVPDMKGSNEIVNGGILKKGAMTDGNQDDNNCIDEPVNNGTKTSSNIEQDEASPIVPDVTSKVIEKNIASILSNLSISPYEPLSESNSVVSLEKTVDKVNSLIPCPKTVEKNVIINSKVDTASFLKKVEQDLDKNSVSVPSTITVEKVSANQSLTATSTTTDTTTAVSNNCIPLKQKERENYNDFGEIVAREMQALATKYSDESLDDLKLQILGTLEKFKSAKKSSNSRTLNLLKALGNTP